MVVMRACCPSVRVLLHLLDTDHEYKTQHTLNLYPQIALIFGHEKADCFYIQIDQKSCVHSIWQETGGVSEMDALRNSRRHLQVLAHAYLCACVCMYVCMLEYICAYAHVCVQVT
jgi:hypothetical protein